MPINGGFYLKRVLVKEIDSNRKLLYSILVKLNFYVEHSERFCVSKQQDSNATYVYGELTKSCSQRFAL